jgi:hypothetical protein
MRRQVSSLPERKDVSEAESWDTPWSRNGNEAVVDEKKRLILYIIGRLKAEYRLHEVISCSCRSEKCSMSTAQSPTHHPAKRRGASQIGESVFYDWHQEEYQSWHIGEQVSGADLFTEFLKKDAVGPNTKGLVETTRGGPKTMQCHTIESSKCIPDIVCHYLFEE